MKITIGTPIIAIMGGFWLLNFLLAPFIILVCGMEINWEIFLKLLAFFTLPVLIVLKLPEGKPFFSLK